MDKKQNFTPAQQRVVWMLDTLYAGNRAAMCRATGVSMTGLAKVITGQQDAGRRLLEKLATNTEVNPSWLLTGEGSQLRGSGLPVADACLPGTPDDHRDLLTTGKVSELDSLYSPTRYWLKLSPGEWAVRPSATRIKEDIRLDSETGLAAGDHLLMESDRKKFPPLESLSGCWCALRVDGKPVRLARLDYTSVDGELGVLEAQTYRLAAPKARRLIVDELPDGSFQVTARDITAGGHRPAPAGRTPPEVLLFPEVIQLRDIVAVCVLLVRRFGDPTK